MSNESGPDRDLGDTESLKDKLNRDTARIQWSALTSYNQNDSIIEVDASLDLVNVACEFVADNTKQVGSWLESGLLVKVTETVSDNLKASDPEVWAVVVPPWILIQNKP
ncbi:MAG: DUF2288 domain-containing protein [Pseudohongiellaceae bacterium]